MGDSAAMRELDALNQEIEELRREKESLTSEIQQKELAIKTTSLEVQVCEKLVNAFLHLLAILTTYEA